MKASGLLEKLDEIDSFKRYGRVKQVVGLMIESQGPESSIGDLCFIHVGHRKKRVIQAEVVGFRGENVILMPYTSVNDIAPGSLVEATLKPLEIKVGTALIGSVIDALGDSLDGTALPKGLTTVPTEQAPQNPLKRPPIAEPIEVGVRMIDSLLTV